MTRLISYQYFFDRKWVFWYMKSLYFIRHGQSLANTGAKSMPDKDIPLTDLGMEQANHLLKNWQQLNITPSHIYHSPLLRAKQTAEIFNAHLNFELKEIGALKEFACLGFKSVLDMMGAERAVLAKAYWQNADIYFKDGGDADSFDEFQKRVADFLNQVDDFEHNSLFFGHGIWIGMMAWQLFGLTAKNNADMQKFRAFQTALPMYNTVVYRLDVVDGVCQLKIVDF